MLFPVSVGGDICLDGRPPGWDEDGNPTSDGWNCSRVFLDNSMANSAEIGPGLRYTCAVQARLRGPFCSLVCLQHIAQGSQVGVKSPLHSKP